MNTIRFSDGLRAFQLNEKCEVFFNPGDALFVEQLYEAASALNGLQEQMQARTKDADAAEIFKAARETDREMRRVIDGLFGTEVCAALFPNTSVHAIADGMPLWSNLLFAVLDQMDENLSTERARAQERIRKYSEKYTRKYHK